MNKFLGSVAILLVAPAVVGQCVSAGAGATSFGNGDDIVVNGGAGIDMGFLFPVGDGLGGTVSYQFIHPSSNGFCYLSDGTPTYTNSDLSPSEADMFTNEPRVAVCWDDMNLIAANGADLLVDTSVAGQCTVTWVNIVPFGETTTFTMQCILYASGEVDFNYDTPAFNDTDAIVGISPGNSAAGVQPASIDLSGGVPTTNDMTHELFPGFSLDLAGQGIKLVPTLPGYVPVPLTGGCATSSVYGTGCTNVPDASYELFALNGFDLPASMGSNAVTFLLGANEFTILDAIPGTYVAPTAAATVISAADDAFGSVPLSAAMPIPGGTTMSLSAHTNGFVTLDGSQPAIATSWTPTLDKFQNDFTGPTICGPWYDWSPNNGGQFVYEEVAGFMYVTWEDVPPFNSTTGTDRWQMQFELATGNCTIVYDAMTFTGASAWHTPLFGFTPGSAQLPQDYDMSAVLGGGLVSNFTATLPLTLTPSNPVLGLGWDLTTDNIDAISPIAINFIGDATPGAGIPLNVIGLNAPGCSVWLNAVLADVTGINAGGSSTVNIPIPNNPMFTGAGLTAQSICLTLDNPANIKTSNGAQGTVGL